MLDEDHYDLDKVKERIVEYLAVQKLKIAAVEGSASAGPIKGPILCFVGPPGVGKTSLGQSIARAMNRKFVRISLGGVRDEAEIRGHRRTYIGSIPGPHRPGAETGGRDEPGVHAGRDRQDQRRRFQGDPAAALLEVLDPAQNHAFRDHYLEISMDLSRVLFIATANQLGTGPPGAARSHGDHLAGRLHAQKRSSTSRSGISCPRQLEEHALTTAAVTFDDDALTRIIMDYTREAGVRSLERHIGAVVRKIAARMASAEDPQATTRSCRRHRRTISARPASTTRWRSACRGPAWQRAWRGRKRAATCCSSRRRSFRSGHHDVILTGQLGSVMQESARAAVSHIRSQAVEIGVPPDFLDNHDLHIHVPAGAIPKDGPSAGVTIATAIVSGAQEADDPRGRGDDGRDHAERPGAAGRRYSREGARGDAATASRISSCRLATSRTSRSSRRS